MKKIFSILTAVLILAGFASCQKAESEDAFSTSPVAPELAAHNDILIQNPQKEKMSSSPGASTATSLKV